MTLPYCFLRYLSLIPGNKQDKQGAVIVTNVIRESGIDAYLFLFDWTRDMFIAADPHLYSPYTGAYSLDYAASHTACQDIGEQLASRSLYLSAYNGGLHCCGFGWTADAYYSACPNQVSCGGLGKGSNIQARSSSSRFSAFCTGHKG